MCKYLQKRAILWALGRYAYFVGLSPQVSKVTE